MKNQNLLILKQHQDQLNDKKNELFDAKENSDFESISDLRDEISDIKNEIKKTENKIKYNNFIKNFNKNLTV